MGIGAIMSEQDFIEKFLRHKVVVTMICRTYLKSDILAQDAVQEIYLKLWLQKEQLVEVDSPKAYVMRVARNYCIDYLRKEQNKFMLQSLDETFPPIIASNDLDGQAQIEQAELEKTLQHWLSKIKEPKRSVFILAHYDHLGHDEIADKLNLTEVNVRVILSRLRKELKQELTEVLN